MSAGTRGTTRKLLLALLAGSLLAGLAAVASGTVRSDTVTVEGQESRSAKARCPAGTVTEAGGFAAEAHPHTDDANLLTTDSLPVRRRAWRVEAFNEDENDAGSLTAFAYCVRRLPGRAVESETETITGGAIERVKVACPRGATAVSGGFTPASSQIVAVASHRAGDRRWAIEAFNQDMDNAGVRVLVLCADVPALEERTRDAEANGIEPKTVNVRCPRGTTAVSGGWDGHLDLSPPSGTIALVSRRAGGRRWRTVAANASAALDARITAYAYCG